MTVGKTTKNKAIGHAISSRVKKAGATFRLLPVAFFRNLGGTEAIS